MSAAATATATPKVQHTTEQLAQLQQQEIAKLESQITHPQLQMQNTHQNEVFRQVENYFRKFFGDFEAAHHGLVSFSTNVKKTNTELQQPTVTLPPLNELKDQDVLNRVNYFSYFDTALEVNEFVLNIFETARSLKPVPRIALAQVKTEYPDFYEQIVVLDTLSNIREQAATQLGIRGKALHVETSSELQRAHRRVGTFVNIVKKQENHWFTGIQAYDVRRPTAEEGQGKPLTIFSSSTSASAPASLAGSAATVAKTSESSAASARAPATAQAQVQTAAGTSEAAAPAASASASAPATAQAQVQTAASTTEAAAPVASAQESVQSKSDAGGDGLAKSASASSVVSPETASTAPSADKVNPKPTVADTTSAKGSYAAAARPTSPPLNRAGTPPTATSSATPRYNGSAAAVAGLARRKQDLRERQDALKQNQG